MEYSFVEEKEHCVTFHRKTCGTSWLTVHFRITKAIALLNIKVIFMLLMEKHVGLGSHMFWNFTHL